MVIFGKYKLLQKGEQERMLADQVNVLLLVRREMMVMAVGMERTEYI